MSKIDWNSPEQKAAYHRKRWQKYRAEKTRHTLTFSDEEYHPIQNSAQKYEIDKGDLSRHIKQLAVEAARMGLGEQIERPPQVPEALVDEMLFVLRNCANNINQVAYNLNVRAKEERCHPVADEHESKTILDSLFSMLSNLDDEIRPLLTHIQK